MVYISNSKDAKELAITIYNDHFLLVKIVVNPSAEIIPPQLSDGLIEKLALIWKVKPTESKIEECKS
jgi:hypothetical protein